jgi:Protein of unknown function (DUF3102)
MVLRRPCESRREASGSQHRHPADRTSSDAVRRVEGRRRGSIPRRPSEVLRRVATGVSLRLPANEVRPCANCVGRRGPSMTIANTLTRNRALAEHVAAIRQRGKRMISDAIEIGRRLKLCKEIVGHGRWLPWLDEQFGWTDRTALNFMRVHTLATKSEKFSDLALDDLAVPLSSMYDLAAPQTPSEAVAEILERVRKEKARHHSRSTRHDRSL